LSSATVMAMRSFPTPLCMVAASNSSGSRHRAYAADAAPRGKYAAKKVCHGEGRLVDLYDPDYDDDPEDDDASDDDGDAPPGGGKRKRAKGAKQRLPATLGESLVFWCALCDMAKPIQSLKAIEAHRIGKKSCMRGAAGARSAAVDQLAAGGYLFFEEPPQPSTLAGSRIGRGGRGGPSNSGGRGGGRGSAGGRGAGGRGKKSAASKAADKARLATLLAVRREVERAGGSWATRCAAAPWTTKAQPRQTMTRSNARASPRARRPRLRGMPQRRTPPSTSTRWKTTCDGCAGGNAGKCGGRGARRGWGGGVLCCGGLPGGARSAPV
jgi:hypothetical protein